MNRFRIMREAMLLSKVLDSGTIRWDMGAWSAADGSPLPVNDPWQGLHYLRRRNLAKRIKGGWSKDDGQPALTKFERRLAQRAAA